jgi:hypothetical protein
VIGAERLLDGDPSTGPSRPTTRAGTPTGPVNYYAYVPFTALMPWSGRWDDLPAAHGAAVAFDLICVALLFAVGRRVRGPALASCWPTGGVAFPFTLLVSNANANDSLVAALVLLALLVVARPVPRAPPSSWPD